nr:ribosome small subunit-dependent GTPase A [Melioribacteraceae bacterium]
KSTLINKLLGYDLQKTNEIRIKDDRGKHTTTRRELIVLPNGAILIDTPGMREFHIWKTTNGLEEVFSEIDEFASECKYKDCKHINETGCAVLKALKEGLISNERYNSYIKLQKEEEYLELKDDKNYFLQKKDKEKKLSKLIKEDYKYRYKYKSK